VLYPRKPWASTSQRQLLIDSLTAVLPTEEESSQVGLAILQGARALSLADGDFD
jgi:hypothetical protein